MKPGDVNPSVYIDFNKGINQEGPNFKVGDYVRISKHKNIFAKEYVPNYSEEVFVITKVKNTVPGAYVVSNLKGTEKELQKTNQKQFRVEKVIKRKSDTLYVEWKGCDNSFNSLIDKKDIV